MIKGNFINHKTLLNLIILIMKIIYILIFGISILSCKGEKTSSERISINLNYKIDTVVVDPREEIINLKWGLRASAIQDSKGHLFILDKDEGVVDKINLDELVLVEKISYEKEGPNGIGNVTSWIRLLEDDKILIGSPEFLSLFDLEGKVIRRYTEKMEEFIGDDVRGLEYVSGKPVITDEETVYKLSQDFKDMSIKFIKLDYKKRTSKIYDMPGLDELPIYTILYMTEQSFNVASSREEINQYGNKIVFSSDAFSDLYVLDIEKDSLYSVSYTPHLTQASKKGGYPENVGSKSEFQELYTKIDEEVSFMSPVWDADNNLYYRFSYETFEYESQSEDESKTYSKVYLTIFDDEFNVLGESLVKELKNPPASLFVKNGNIWTYANINDELGFIIFKIDPKSKVKNHNK